VKDKVKPQYAALPYRRADNGLEVLLITSRDTGRWVIPKGWAHKQLPAHAVAAKEAFEEAGLVGKVRKRSAGTYRYRKWLSAEEAVTCKVDVFLLEVERQLDDWPERAARETRWLPPAQAATCVAEAGLQKLLRKLTSLVRSKQR
jgi:8-oxo-dGTP pyrophosphatase MutT (NUDIX family)